MSGDRRAGAPGEGVRGASDASGALRPSGHDAPARGPAPSAHLRPDGPAVGESCDYCGSTTLAWRKCKLICGNCRQINKSCADL